MNNNMKMNMQKLIILGSYFMFHSFFVIASENIIEKLSPLNLKVKMFETTEDISNPFGFSYDFAEEIELLNFREPPSINNNYTKHSINTKIDARGNFAFDEKINPADFLASHLNFSYHYNNGGFYPLTDEEKDRKRELTHLLAAKLSKEELLRYQKELSNLSAREDSRNTSNMLKVDFGFNAGLESNQLFTQKQFLYGGKFYFSYDGLTDIKANTYRETSLLGKLNIFDYPFAFIRQFTGYNSDVGKVNNHFLPSNQYFPSISAAFHEVKPEENDPRKNIGDDSSFQRFDLSFHFKTPLVQLKNKENVFFVLNSRFFKELDASNQIKAAELDEYIFTEFSIEGKHVYVSYAIGKLPFEVKEDKYFELGWKLNFN